MKLHTSLFRFPSFSILSFTLHIFLFQILCFTFRFILLQFPHVFNFIFPDPPLGYWAIFEHSWWNIWSLNEWWIWKMIHHLNVILILILINFNYIFQIFKLFHIYKILYVKCLDIPLSNDFWKCCLHPHTHICWQLTWKSLVDFHTCFKAISQG